MQTFAIGNTMRGCSNDAANQTIMIGKNSKMMSGIGASSENSTHNDKMVQSMMAQTQRDTQITFGSSNMSKTQSKDYRIMVAANSNSLDDYARSSRAMQIMAGQMSLSSHRPHFDNSKNSADDKLSEMTINYA